MPYSMPDESYISERNLDYIKRVFILRQIGTVLCYLPILSVLLEQGTSMPVLVLLTLNAIIWPVAALMHSKYSADGLRAEKRNLALDSFWAGAWIACMGASPVPSIIIIGIQIADRFAAGGWKILRLALAGMVIAFLVVWPLTGATLVTSFSYRTVWLSLPLAVGYPVMLSIISRRLSVRLRKRRELLERQALMDPGLDLPNRRFFDQKMTRAFRATINGRINAYLMLIDVDNFKSINDTYGHEVGDALLAKISSVLREVLGEQDIPARFGGDELAIIVNNSNDHQVIGKAILLQEKLSSLHLPSYENIHCTVSIGIASARGKSSITSWVRGADKMLYEVKRNGKNGYQLYTGHDDKR